MKLLYLDHNATTPVLPAVWEAMRPYLLDFSGNPASSHQAGRRARQALEDARELTATLLGADPNEIIFTSGATEANNLAMFGLVGAPPGQLLVSPVEHPCVLEPAKQLQSRGFTLEWLLVDEHGVVAFPGLESRLIAVQLANHETGTIQSIQALADRTTAFHCDAAAAAGKIPIDFHALGVTTLAISAHKFHGPQGVGALLLKRGAKLRPLAWGGHQQQGHRPGTEPVALAVGLAAALQLAVNEIDERTRRVRALRSRLLNGLQKAGVPFVLNSPPLHGLPHTLNLSFPGCRADVLLMNLDLAGVACSTGSACSSGSLLPSPVLKAMRVPEDRLLSAMRFSLSPYQTDAEMDEAANRICLAATRSATPGSAAPHNHSP